MSYIMSSPQGVLVHPGLQETSEGELRYLEPTCVQQNLSVLEGGRWDLDGGLHRHPDWATGALPLDWTTFTFGSINAP